VVVELDEVVVVDDDALEELELVVEVELDEDVEVVVEVELDEDVVDVEVLAGAHGW
jgi:hypothetical protein